MDGEVTPDRVDELREADDVDVCIVDIRNPSSFARGHIPGSLNVPLPQLTARVDGLPDADRVVTVCPHGKSSVQAARLIASYEGVDAPVESMHGGLTAYDGPIDTGRPDDDTDQGPRSPF
jgi:rhodanese-related sulfurtransferase